MKIYDVIILGSGPSGLTAAIYNSRAKLNTLVLAGNPPGGQLMWTTEVENFPGFEKGIMGPELIDNMRKQAQRFGTQFIDDNVTNISGSFEENFTLTTETNKKYQAKSIIVATGASARWLNIESEQKLRGKGVSACATCDAFFFKDKVVAVVGGGDSAMEESTYLTKFAKKVYVLVRGTQKDMKASKIMQQEALENEKIEFIFNTQVKEVLGDNFVTGVKVENSETKEITDIELQGLFIAIGHIPNTKFLTGLIDLLPNGYIDVKDTTKTNVEGIFVAGDVADYKYRQAISAAGVGCMAALDVEKFLKSKGLDIKGTAAY